jgi:regulator of sigma E protease
MDIVIWLFLALFPLVLIHEFGHFIVAKANGIHVDEFGIGFPPRVAKLFHHGGTDYTVNILPLGGFVRLVGEDDPTVPGAFAAKSKKARAAVLAAGPIANFLLAAVILSAVAMAGLPEPVPGIRAVLVTSVEEGMPANVAGMLAGDLIVAVDGSPISEMAVGAEPSQAGETAEVAALIDATDAATGRALAVTVLRGLTRVEDVGDVTGARTAPMEKAWFAGSEVTDAGAVAGLRPGDIILDAQCDDAPDVVRGGEEIVINVTPTHDELRDQGRMGIAVSPAGLPVQVGPLEGVQKGVQLTGLMLVAMVNGLKDMVARGDASGLSGPVGIAAASKQSAEGGAANFFAFMALLSLNLGLINLFPVPALDGGRLMFILFEAMRGRRIEPSREQLVHVIGFVVVIGLMIVLTFREVAALIGLQLP